MEISNLNEYRKNAASVTTTQKKISLVYIWWETLALSILPDLQKMSGNPVSNQTRPNIKIKTGKLTRL